MKKTVICGAMLTVALIAQAADEFTIEGDIPKIPEDAVVKLVKWEGKRDVLAQGVAKKGRFTLTGMVERPTLCELQIDLNDEEAMDKSVSMMVENTGMTVKAKDIGSMPDSFYVGSAGLEKERGIVITGGRAQKEYKEYQEAMYPYSSKARDAHYALYWDDSRDKTPEAEKKYAEVYSKASMAEIEARNEFVAAHPSYSISGKLMEESLHTPFSRSLEELAELESTASLLWDEARRADLMNAIEKARKYPKGDKYSDFALLDPEGKRFNLSDYHDGGQYTLVDFWASWCGPCRAAIPHVRELWRKYSGKLKVLAVSLDESENAWRKAMEKEGMEWQQGWADKELAKPVKEAYHISTIPFILILEPDGHIVFSGNDPDKVTDFLNRALY